MAIPGTEKLMMIRTTNINILYILRNVTKIGECYSAINRLPKLIIEKHVFLFSLFSWNRVFSYFFVLFLTISANIRNWEFFFTLILQFLWQIIKRLTYEFSLSRKAQHLVETIEIPGRAWRSSLLIWSECSLPLYQDHRHVPLYTLIIIVNIYQTNKGTSI